MKGAAGRGRRRRAPLVLSLPSRTEFLGLLRDLARRLALDAGFDEATAGGLALAVDEAATNVIEHAYQGRADGLLELRFDHLGQDFRVELIDSGTTIDPAKCNTALGRYWASRLRTKASSPTSPRTKWT